MCLYLDDSISMYIYMYGTFTSNSTFILLNMNIAMYLYVCMYLNPIVAFSFVCSTYIGMYD